jgi:hypothetical protein
VKIKTGRGNEPSTAFSGTFYEHFVFPLRPAFPGVPQFAPICLFKRKE